MKNKWSAEDSALYEGLLGQCVLASRLIGQDPGLVLHGGGNSSVKAPFEDVTGRQIDALWVKGSGWEMGSILKEGFAALPMLRLRELLELDVLSDEDMGRELRAARLDSAHPSPSVETLLHASLPFVAIQHSHADVILNLTNAKKGEAFVREVFGDDVVVIPYVKPGFDLARQVRDEWPKQAHPGTKGMVLMNHGLFSFGEDSRVAYESHVALISRAEKWLDENAGRRGKDSDRGESEIPTDVLQLASLRRSISSAAGHPVIMHQEKDRVIENFVLRADLADIASGPLTPDHVIRTKSLPLIGDDVETYVKKYEDYVSRNHAGSDVAITKLDPAPRIVLGPDFGMLSIGANWKEAKINSDIYRRTIPVIESTTDYLGGYEPLPEQDLFDVEYWELEQAKLGKKEAPSGFQGQVALVTGANSGIGRACAQELADSGAVVVGVDIAPEITSFDVGPGSLGIQADLTDDNVLSEIVEKISSHAGGLDIVVLSAGIFGPTQAIADYNAQTWAKVHAINFTSVLPLMAAIHPMLANSPAGGRVVAIASKNVPAPGAGAAAYSTSKAALAQLVRVAAIEWAPDGIRVNGLHPDAVFDTGLWQGGMLEERAARYSLSVDEYRRRNLLEIEISSHDVARAAAALCSDEFRATTGSMVPVDGGNERVI